MRALVGVGLLLVALAAGCGGAENEFEGTPSRIAKAISGHCADGVSRFQTFNEAPDYEAYRDAADEAFEISCDEDTGDYSKYARFDKPASLQAASNTFDSESPHRARFCFLDRESFTSGFRGFENVCMDLGGRSRVVGGSNDVRRPANQGAD